MFNRDHIVVLDGRRVCERKREALDWTGDGTPDIDDTVAAFQQRLGFVWEVELDALFCGFRGLVDMRASDGSAVGIWIRATDGVVEEEDSVGGAGEFFEEELFDFGVEDGLDAFVAVPVDFIIVRVVFEERKRCFVKVETVFIASRVLEMDLVVVFAVVALRAVFWNFDVVPWFFVIWGWFVEVQCG